MFQRLDNKLAEFRYWLIEKLGGVPYHEHDALAADHISIQVKYNNLMDINIDLEKDNETLSIDNKSHIKRLKEMNHHALERQALIDQLRDDNAILTQKLTIPAPSVQQKESQPQPIQMGRVSWARQRKYYEEQDVRQIQAQKRKIAELHKEVEGIRNAG